VHQVGDQTKVILRCTVNQPSRYVLLSTTTNFISYFSKCCNNAWWWSTGLKHVAFTDEANKIWWLALGGLWLLICFTTVGWIKRKITTEILFQSQHNSCGICGGQSGTGTGFVQEFHLSSPPYSSLTRGCYGRHILGHSMEGLWPTALLQKYTENFEETT